MKTSDRPVVVSEYFKASALTIWKAITELDQMTQWFFTNIPSFKPEEGFTTEFIVENEDRIFPHLWKIKEVQPLKKIVYDWRYKGFIGIAEVTFEIFETPTITELKVSHKILADFDSSIPEFTVKNCHQGWTYFIKERLKDFIEQH